MTEFQPTSKTTVKRLPSRARFDRETVYDILDEGMICHLGFVDQGHPFVIPTSYGRSGDTLYVHGSSAGRTMRSLGTGIPLCITVTLVDGLVLARSAFHHSINYRSVMIFGTGTIVESLEEKEAALRIFMEHLLPGRWEQVRPPTEQELKATLVLSIPLEEVSAKVRTGPPVDDEPDYALPVWAGVLPLSLTPGDPVPDSRLLDGMNPPDVGCGKEAQ